MHIYILPIYIYKKNTFGCKPHYKYFHTTMHCIKGRGSGNKNNNKGGYCNIHVLCLWNIFIIRVLSQLLIHHLLTLPTIVVVGGVEAAGTPTPMVAAPARPALYPQMLETRVPDIFYYTHIYKIRIIKLNSY